jgi:hypothetical protein
MTINDLYIAIKELQHTVNLILKRLNEGGEE